MTKEDYLADIRNGKYFNGYDLKENEKRNLHNLLVTAVNNMDRETVTITTDNKNLYTNMISKFKLKGLDVAMKKKSSYEFEGIITMRPKTVIADFEKFIQY